VVLQKDGRNVAAVFAFRGTQPWSVSDWIIDFDYYAEDVEWWPVKKPLPKARCPCRAPAYVHAHQDMLC
jgi:hypothetical protein